MWKEFKTLGPYFREHWKKYFFGLFFLVLVDAAQLLIPQFIKNRLIALLWERAQSKHCFAYSFEPHWGCIIY